MVAEQIIVRRARPDDAERIDEITYNAFKQAQRVHESERSREQARRSSYVCAIKGSALKRQKDAQTFVAIKIGASRGSPVMISASPASARSASPASILRSRPVTPARRSTRTSASPSRDRDAIGMLAPSREEEGRSRMRSPGRIFQRLRKPAPESRFDEMDFFSTLSEDDDSSDEEPFQLQTVSRIAHSSFEEDMFQEISNRPKISKHGKKVRLSLDGETDNDVDADGLSRVHRRSRDRSPSPTFGKHRTETLGDVFDDHENVDGPIVGCVTLAPHGCGWDVMAKCGEGELRMLAVTERKGVATKLVERALAEAHGLGLIYVWALTPVQAVTAQNLYMKLGFERVQESDFFEPRTNQRLKAYGMDSAGIRRVETSYRAQLIKAITTAPSRWDGVGGLTFRSIRAANESRGPSLQRRIGLNSPSTRGASATRGSPCAVTQFSKRQPSAESTASSSTGLPNVFPHHAHGSHSSSRGEGRVSYLVPADSIPEALPLTFPAGSLTRNSASPLLPLVATDTNSSHASVSTTASSVVTHRQDPSLAKPKRDLGLDRAPRHGRDASWTRGLTLTRSIGPRFSRDGSPHHSRDLSPIPLRDPSPTPSWDPSPAPRAARHGYHTRPYFPRPPPDSVPRKSVELSITLNRPTAINADGSGNLDGRQPKSISFLSDR